MMYKRNWTELIIFLALLLSAHGDVSERREVDISRNGKFILGWTIDSVTSRITIDIQADFASIGSGYVGFGLNDNGAMDGADLMIMGINEADATYIMDFHSSGIGGHSPIDDQSNDYRVESIQQNNGGITLAKFSRLLDTKDSNDKKITDADIHVLWSLGNNHNVQPHDPANKGSYVLNFMNSNAGRHLHSNSLILIASVLILTIALMWN